MNPTTHLQQAQVLQAILDQFLYPTFFGLVLVLAERVSRLAAGIVAEVEVGELGRLAEQRAELYDTKDRINFLEQRYVYPPEALEGLGVGEDSLGDSQYLSPTRRTKDRTWKAVSRCKLATDMMIDEGDWRTINLKG